MRAFSTLNCCCFSWHKDMCARQVQDLRLKLKQTSVTEEQNERGLHLNNSYSVAYCLFRKCMSPEFLPFINLFSSSVGLVIPVSST